MFESFEGLRGGEIGFLVSLYIKDRDKFYKIVSLFQGKAQKIADYISSLVDNTIFGEAIPEEYLQHPGNFFVNSDTVWTKFWDMHSGGSAKMYPVDKIYIEADEDTAIEIFEAKFNRYPYNVTCSCCGPDYSVSEWDNIEEATAFHRDSRPLSAQYDSNYNSIPPKSGDLMPLWEYENLETVLFVRTGLLAQTLMLTG